MEKGVFIFQSSQNVKSIETIKTINSLLHYHNCYQCFILYMFSLHSKRFRGVGEQRKTKERSPNTVFCPREIGVRAKRRKKGWGRGRKETLADKPQDFENLRSPANRAREWLDQSNIIDMC